MLLNIIIDINNSCFYKWRSWRTPNSCWVWIFSFSSSRCSSSRCSSSLPPLSAWSPTPLNLYPSTPQCSTSHHHSGRPFLPALPLFSVFPAHPQSLFFFKAGSEDLSIVFYVRTVSCGARIPRRKRYPNTLHTAICPPSTPSRFRSWLRGSLIFLRGCMLNYMIGTFIEVMVGGGFEVGRVPLIVLREGIELW